MIERYFLHLHNNNQSIEKCLLSTHFACDCALPSPNLATLHRAKVVLEMFKVLGLTILVIFELPHLPLQ